MAISVTSVTLTVDDDEFGHLMWGLGVWEGDLQRGLRKRKDDGLNDSRRSRIEELRVLRDKLVSQRTSTIAL